MSEATEVPARRAVWRLASVCVGAFHLVHRAAANELYLVLGLQLVGAVAALSQVVVVRQLLRSVLGTQAPGRDSLSLAIPALVLLLVISTVGGLAGSVQSNRQILMAELVERETLGRVLNVTTRLELASYDDPAFHDRLQRARQGALERPYQLTSGLFGLLGSGLAIVGLAVALASIQPALLLVLLLLLLPLAFAASRTGRMFYGLSLEFTPRDRERNYLFTLLTGRTQAAEVRAYGIADFLRHRHDDLYEERIQAIRGLVRHRTGYHAAAAVGSGALVLAAVVLLAFMVSGRLVEPAGAGAATVAILLLSQQLRGMALGVSQLYESSLFLDDFTSFIDLAADRGLLPEAAAPGELQNLEARHVSFTYRGAAEPALRDISVAVRRGEVIAVVGANGSGKTTLAKLLCGLYAPSEGEILADGRPMGPGKGGVPDVAVIFQDFVRYMLTAKANVGIGRHERFGDLRGIRAAAGLSGAESVIEGLPEGYDTVLGPEFEGGVEISSGQWQRVALARALFRDASILILDEPTATLDPAAEQAVFEGLRQLAREKGIVLISHRFSSVRSADHIVVLDGGRVIEEGRHDELMTLGGRYAQLFSAQAASYTV